VRHWKCPTSGRRSIRQAGLIGRMFILAAECGGFEHLKQLVNWIGDADGAKLVSKIYFPGSLPALLPAFRIFFRSRFPFGYRLVLLKKGNEHHEPGFGLGQHPLEIAVKLAEDRILLVGLVWMSFPFRP
jgi:hypothetical protein